MMLLDLIGGPGVLIGIGTTLAAIVWGLLGRRSARKQGRRELAEEIVREDAKNADTMEEAVDEVLDRERPRNAIDRLRDQGRLRRED